MKEWSSSMEENKTIDEMIADIKEDLGEGMPLNEKIEEKKDPSTIFATVNDIENEKKSGVDILGDLLQDSKAGFIEEPVVEKIEAEILHPKPEPVEEKVEEPVVPESVVIPTVQESFTQEFVEEKIIENAVPTVETAMPQVETVAPTAQPIPPVQPVPAPAAEIPVENVAPPPVAPTTPPPAPQAIPPQYTQGQPTYTSQPAYESPYPPNYYAPNFQAPPQQPQQYASFQNQPVADPNVPYTFDFSNVEQSEVLEKDSNKGIRVFGLIILTIAMLFVGGFAIYGIIVATTGELPSIDQDGSMGGVITPNNSSSTPNVTITPYPGASDIYPVEEGTLSNTAIYEKVSPSVVGVICYYGNSFFSGESEGSGIIMSEDGYIITNAHVVESSQLIEIVLVDGRSFDAEIVGVDTATDLAVLKVAGTDLPAAEFGDSDALQIGERVVAIGNPGGMQFASSLTVGCVSALNRTISASDSGYALELIQTDAAINPGNSGGALINAYGQVIGINSAKLAGDAYEGMGFAIPITDAVPILDDIIINGQVTTRAMLGISAEAISAVYAQQANIPVGLHIVAFSEGNTLEENGAKTGDIITHIDSYPIFSVDSCSEVLKNKSPGDTVALSLYRMDRTGKGTTINITAQLIGSGS